MFYKTDSWNTKTTILINMVIRMSIAILFGLMAYKIYRDSQEAAIVLGVLAVAAFVTVFIRPKRCLQDGQCQLPQ